MLHLGHRMSSFSGKDGREEDATVHIAYGNNLH